MRNSLMKGLLEIIKHPFHFERGVFKMERYFLYNQDYFLPDKSSRDMFPIYTSTTYNFSQRLSMTLQYTYMNYLEQGDFQFAPTLPADSLRYSGYTFPNHNTALFAENIFRLTPRLSITPGLRYEHITTRAQGNYTNAIIDLAGNPINPQRIIDNKSNIRHFLFGGVGVAYRHFMLSANINNLANAHYFTRRADSYPGPGIVPADARSFYVTLQCKL